MSWRKIGTLGGTREPEVIPLKIERATGGRVTHGIASVDCGDGADVFFEITANNGGVDSSSWSEIRWADQSVEIRGNDDRQVAGGGRYTGLLEIVGYTDSQFSVSLPSLSVDGWVSIYLD